MKYKIGDKFIFESFGVENQEYILAEVDRNKAALICINTGNRWKNPVEIKESGYVDKRESFDIGINDMKKINNNGTSR